MESKTSVKSESLSGMLRRCIERRILIYLVATNLVCNKHTMLNFFYNFKIMKIIIYWVN